MAHTKGGTMLGAGEIGRTYQLFFCGRDTTVFQGSVYETFTSAVRGGKREGREETKEARVTR